MSLPGRITHAYGGFDFVHDPGVAETLHMRNEGATCGVLPPKSRSLTPVAHAPGEKQTHGQCAFSNGGTT